ncbi:MAG: phosphoribosyltransferase, partial [Acidobacteria bacterium]|nr:phosphoribosyltransferase [Acidobacteriota bacterium]
MSERRRLPALFEPRLKECLELKAYRDFNEGSWGAWFGQVQKALRESVWAGNAIQHCHLDFTDCVWADPLPLLSLALSLVEFEQKGGTVSIAFPSPPDLSERRSHEQYIEQSRLLKYLAREGLLELLAFPKVTTFPGQSLAIQSKRIVTIGSDQATPENFGERLKRLAELPAPLAFEESTCLKATILQLRRPDPDDASPLDAIDQWVEQALYRDIERVVDDKVPRWAQRGLTYRLLMFLRETLHNVAEHAYAESGLAAVYVRYREGALGQAPSTWYRLDKHVQRESNNNNAPLLQTKKMAEAFARTRTGFFEVYVLDGGCGLCQTMGRVPSRDDKDPVHQTMLDVFDRWCSSKRNRSTEYGGLYLIRLLLEPVHDYVRVRDEDTWWGTDLPVPTSEQGIRLAGQIALKARGLEHTGESIRGVAWTSRMSWLERTDTVSREWCGLDKEEDNARVLSVLQETDSDLSILDGINIYDRRFGSDPWNEPTNAPKHARQMLLLLPGRYWMKNRIQDEIAQVLKGIQPMSDGCLIIGDIASEEAITYLAAVQNASKFTQPPLSFLARVTLVTRNLKVCVLEKDERQLFHARESLSWKYVYRSIAGARFRAQSLTQYVRLIRLHDARRLWEIARPNTSVVHGSVGRAFLDELIDWNDMVLDCYLDFPETLTHPVCREIYRVTLERLTGLFPGQDCQLSALDSLLDSLVVRFNADRHPHFRFKDERGRRVREEPPRKDLRIGTVQVSGLTERIASGEGTQVFHFFKHPNGTAAGHYLLPWLAVPSRKTLELPLSEHPLRPGAYRRVGRTPVIARDGWKAYHLPRFDKSEQPVYEQGPRDSYRAWQEPSRTTMKIGHWRYGGHHDLLSVNLMLAFDTELDRISLVLAGSLARWVYANLFRTFCLENAHLTVAGQSLRGAIEQDRYQRLLPEDLADQNPVLLYPSHPVTDHVVDRFLSFIGDHNRLEEIRARMLPMLAIRRHRGGSGLQLSGLTLDRLEGIRFGYGKKRPPVVFFDDAMISGRTYEELKRLLRSKGFKDVYSLVLLDRQRLPSADHVGGKRHVCYWRQDVPSMGSRAHCPLCQALSRVQDLSTSIVSQEHRRRIESWLKHWKAHNPTTDWSEGLRPSPISLLKADRKFGIVPDEKQPGVYRQIGDDSQRIRLSNSAGLVAWVTELHAMTSRDDLPLSLLQKENLDPEVRIQLVASQLLLYFGELDAALAHDLGLQLLAALWDAEEHDRNTALAVLTLVACGNAYLSHTIKEFMKNEVRQHLVARDKDMPWFNVDLVILIAFCLELRFLEDSPELERASRLLKPGSTRRDVYWRLHREVQDVQGAAHTSPLHRLTGWDALPPDYSGSIPNIIASVGQLKAISTQFQRHWLQPDADAYKKFGEVLAAIGQESTALESNLRNLLEAIKLGSGTTADIFQACQKHAVKLLEAGTKLHAALFLPWGFHTDGDKKECKMLRAMEYVLLQRGEIDGKSIVFHKSNSLSDEIDAGKLMKRNLMEAYVVWDTEVTRALREILTNARWAEGDPIPCPWDNCQHSPTSAHLWIRVIPARQYALIELANRTSKPSDIVEEDTR